MHARMLGLVGNPEDGTALAKCAMHPLHPAIPRVLCPSCGQRLSLARIRPGSADQSVLAFKCECGFDYEMSAPQPAARKQAQADSQASR